jgi:hypothetical protein
MTKISLYKMTAPCFPLCLRMMAKRSILPMLKELIENGLYRKIPSLESVTTARGIVLYSIVPLTAGMDFYVMKQRWWDYEYGVET